jgi:ASC-1-like (ASCH) protein
MKQMGIHSDSLRLIMAGEKTIEGRLGTEKFLSFLVDDEISIREDIVENGHVISSRDDVARIVITKIDRFATFRDMLEKLGFEKFRPADKNLEAALKTYRQLYSPEDEARYGTLALTFRLKG